MFFTSTIKQLDLHIQLYDEIVELLKQGIPLVHVLLILESRHHKFKKKLSEMRESLLSGNSFFNTFHCLLPNSASIDVGDSIMVPDIIIFFQDLKALFKNQFLIINQLATLLRYPFFLCVVVFFLFLFLILFIIPQYYLLLDGMNASVPDYFNALFFISLFLKQHFLFIVIVVIILLIFLRDILRDRFSLLINFYDNKISDLAILAVFLKNGISLTSALQALSKKYSFKTVLQDTFHSGDFVESLHNVYEFNMLQHSQLMFAQRHGCIADTLLLITNQQYKNQVEKWQSYLFWFQPILLCFIASLIAIFIFIIFIPIMNSI